jgi:hypothetical protein
MSIFKNPEKFNLGDDVTEELEVSKYDEEAQMNKYIENAGFPAHLMPFTDEPRVQSEPKYLELFNNKAYVATIKYYGTSSSFVLNPNDQE